MVKKHKTSVRVSGLVFLASCYLWYNPALHLTLIAIFR
jgi:hypothetical protein